MMHYLAHSSGAFYLIASMTFPKPHAYSSLRTSATTTRSVSWRSTATSTARSTTTSRARRRWPFGGLLAAMRKLKTKLSEHKFLFLGAGEVGPLTMEGRHERRGGGGGYQLVVLCDVRP